MRNALTLAVLTFLAAPSLQAQKYRWEENKELGVKFRVSDKLKAIPMKLGQSDPHRRGRFEPADEGDYIHGKYGKFSWKLVLMAFDKQSAATTGNADKPKPKSEDEAKKAAEAAALAAARMRSTSNSFEEWVKIKARDRAKRNYLVEKKAKKGTSKRPGYELWEYTDVRKMRSGAGQRFDHLEYKMAAVYTIGSTEVALIVELPVKKGKRPAGKYLSLAKKMVTSLVPLKAGDAVAGKGDNARDQYAKTAQQKKALDRLKKNIGDLGNWDYFTTPNYIITYSWDKPRKRTKAKAFAKRISARLEEIRQKFVEYYPPHEKVVKNYSVIRVCADYDDFTKYGQTPSGVVGWFSPGSKELCVFYDTDKRFGDENYIIGVCYHEAWHQYADGYWPGVTLHRWFDEGIAEFFNSWRLRGRKWKIEYLKGRLQAIKRQITEKTLIPAHEIVTWSRAKFYGPRAPDHYAQAYGMLDFLIRGKKKLGKKWDPSWDKILGTYSDICMNQKDSKQAVLKAFKGVDFDKLDAAWIKWVKSGAIRKM